MESEDGERLASFGSYICQIVVRRNKDKGLTPAETNVIGPPMSLGIEATRGEGAQTGDGASSHPSSGLTCITSSPFPYYCLCALISCLFSSSSCLNNSGSIPADVSFLSSLVLLTSS